MSDTHGTAIATVEPIPVPQRMHPVVQLAMGSGGQLDPAMIRDLLAVQREWEAGEARKAYTRDMVALKRDLPTVIAKDKTVTFGKTTYQHASLAAIMDAVTPALSAHGFSLSWATNQGDREIQVTARLTHRDGHCEETAMRAGPDTAGSKSPVQALASTVTMLSRHTALALLGIATADQPDAAATPHDPRPEAVDAAKNLQACRAIVARGHTREEAETLVGAPVDRWTAAHRGTLRAWLAEPSREPGSDG